MLVLETRRRDSRLDGILEAVLENKAIRDTIYETDVDHNGYPAVWIWLIVSDEAAPNAWERCKETVFKLEEAIRNDGRYWPYVSFRSVSEQEEMKA